MMKKIYLGLLSLLVVGLFLVGCSTGEAVSKSNICSGWGKYCSALVLSESNEYKLAGSNYKIRLTDIIYQNYAGGVHSATFNINGKVVALVEGEEQPLGDGRFISLTEVVYQDYAGGIKSAAFCIT